AADHDDAILIFHSALPADFLKAYGREGAILDRSVQKYLVCDMTAEIKSRWRSACTCGWTRASGISCLTREVRQGA
ncbi:MAG: hypothetical protein AAGF78_14150, partial [Pseudomonadota bacterium]